jgi:acetylornithine deacetylase/succinyl-diaminopimelate desuccinylase-like protein
MSDNRKNAIEYFHNHHEKFLNQLIDFLKIPSISTYEESKKAIQTAANWMANELSNLKIENVKVIPTEGHPVVYGEYLKAGKNKFTVLIYGHYDVQPADPLDLWESGAFEPSQRGKHLFARGASDMKGQIVACLAAVESIIKSDNLPVNIKFLIEGEEEIGSPNLAKFLKDNKNLLSSTVALNPDTGMIASDIPTIVYGLRGLAYFELKVFGPAHDLHSGVFGGVINNPAIALCELIAGMRNKDGKITLPGFYDTVLPISREEKEELARLPLDDKYYLTQTGSPEVYGEKGYTSTERVGARPTLDVNGFLSGFTGKGSKTVIPAWAMVKLSMRLVPNQDPETVHKQLIAYLEKHAPTSIRWELIKMAGGPASMADRNHPATQALFRALETVWGKRPVYKREGGSVPIVSDMQEILNLPSVLTGFGLPDDNIHAPNEKLHLPTWYRGIESLIHFFYNL